MGALTRDDIQKIAGTLSEARTAEIIATGATGAELMEAMEWLMADDVMGTKLRKSRSGRVAQLYEILLADRPEYNERER
ncbi:MAG: hypothetical protein U1F33_08790 [Alphaproteobacteria bacterium]